MLSLWSLYGDRCVAQDRCSPIPEYFRPFHKKGAVVTAQVWDSLSYKRGNQPYSRKPCAVDSVVIINPTNMIGQQGEPALLLFCLHSFTDTFDTLYYRRQLKPEEVHDSQSHARWSSLKGGSDSGRADGTVVHQVLRCQSKAQMINAFVQQVKTIAITADELWSFIQKTKTLSAWGT